MSEIAQILVLTARSAVDAGVGIALRIFGLQMAIDPATTGELVVDLAPGWRIEIARDDPYARAIVASLDEVRHLFRLALRTVSSNATHSDGQQDGIGGAAAH